MKQAIKKSMVIIFAALLTTATASVLTGCGENKDESGAATTAASTTAANTTASKAQNGETTQNQNYQNSQSEKNSGSGNSSSQSDGNPSTDSDGYIDEQTAIANVKQQAGSGATVVSSTKGFAPDGMKAWVVVVQPITTGEGDETVTYYTGYQFCYSDKTSENYNSDVSTDSDGYIDEQTAIANVKQQAGSGATVVSSTKGFSPDGTKAWVVVVQPITNGEGDETVTYYSGYQFCYSANNA